MGDNLIACIKKWFTGKKQRILLNGQASKWLLVTSGVLQGSVIGSILIIIYINDLELGLKSTLSKFADDINVGGKDLTTADCEIIQRSLDQITQW